MATNQGTEIATQVICSDTYSFPAWFALLRSHCQLRDCWDQINPDAPDAVSSEAKTTVPEFGSWILGYEEERRGVHKRLIEDFRERKRTDKLATGEKEPAPYTRREIDRLEQDYDRFLSRQLAIAPTRAFKSSDKQKIWEWIQKTVSNSVLSPHLIGLVDQGNFSVQQVVRNIKSDLAPSHSSTVNTVQTQYRQHLVKARKQGIKPQVWYREFVNLYLQARTYQLPEVEGFTASDEFLQAISVRIAPGWATSKRQELIEKDAYGETIESLERLSKGLAALLHHNELATTSGTGSVFATLSSNSTSNSSGNKNQAQTGQQGSSTSRNGRGKTYECPCRPPEGWSTHYWKPVDCHKLRYALTGEKDPALRVVPDEAECNRTKERVKENRFKNLWPGLIIKKWLTETWKQGVEKVTGASSSSGYPGALRA
ncbi:hypothetical protein VSDG_06260 [Cytospora chrysosperma]|uniref:Uncharacterized protein n=1 Tax=Cytospora chrysosperma TaxID=252740 RepID=A0A423VST6_CYTCH|nr:hypothetical protein VSDG_06260 [Valsa sordida]